MTDPITERWKIADDHDGIVFVRRTVGNNMGVLRNGYDEDTRRGRLAGLREAIMFACPVCMKGTGTLFVPLEGPIRGTEWRHKFHNGDDCKCLASGIRERIAELEALARGSEKKDWQ